MTTAAAAAAAAGTYISEPADRNDSEDVLSMCTDLCRLTNVVGRDAICVFMVYNSITYLSLSDPSCRA